MLFTSYLREISLRLRPAALVRGGRVPQYVASVPIFADVIDSTTRNSVESVQRFPAGKLFFDADNTRNFYPNAATSRLAAAVALVKAANLQPAATTAQLIAADAATIPSDWRGYVAVALEKNLLETDGGKFSPNRALTRAELAAALVRFNKPAIE